MTDPGNSTILRRYIGRMFSELRARRGLAIREAARRIYKSVGTLHRLEKGEQMIMFRPPDVQIMLDVYRATPAESERLLALTAEARAKKAGDWWTPSSLHNPFDLYMALEDSAATIRAYESELIHGLIQTPQYARALFHEGVPIVAGRADEERVEQMFAVRSARQALLDRENSPNLFVVLNEAVLRRPVGGTACMAAQLTHLLDVMDGHPKVSVRVVPFSAASHAGMIAGTSFGLLDFPPDPDGGTHEPPLAYVDSLTGAMYASEPETVAVYQRIWRDTFAKALDDAASRAMITQAKEDFRA